MGDREIAEKGAGIGGYDGEMCVIALESTHKRMGDRTGGITGEGRGRVEVFYCGLKDRVWLVWMFYSIMSDLRGWCCGDRLTPLYLFASFETLGL